MPYSDQYKNTDLQSRLLEGLNPEQARVASTERGQGVQVIAGAGTGKTHLISRRFALLVEEMKAEGLPSPEEKILAVTFTVKAAREMRERIHRLLTTHQMDGLSPYTSITNFHGFCNRLLRRHALDIGLTPNFSILGGLEQTLLMTRLFDGMKHNEYATILPALKRANLADVLSPNILSVDALQQLPVSPIGKALDDFLGILGKIKSTGLSPRQFFDTALNQSRRLTKTLKALPLRNSAGGFFEDNETYCRVWHQHLADWGDDHWHFLGDTMTEEAFHDKKCRDSAKPDRYDWSNNESYYQERLKWLAKYEYPKKQRAFVWFDGVKKKFTSGTEDLSFLNEIQAEEEQFIGVLAAVYALYQYILHQQNICDFDDLINRSLELFEACPHLRQHYQSSFEAIIVDEFQDSNGSQLRLMQQLLRPNAAQVTVVGDLKQSIYGFRHAQPENMDLIFDGRSYNAVALHTNYRSQASVLAVANRLAEMITGDQSQRLDLSDKNAALADSPKVTWVELGVKTEKETKKNGLEYKHQEKIETLREREGRFIAREIAELITSGQYEPQDVAVLVSKHGRADEIEWELRQLGIPAIKQKNKGFFNEPVILDALALLRLLHNPYHEGALVRLLQKKLNHRQLRMLADQKKREHPYEKRALFQVLEALADSSFLPGFSLAQRTALVNLATELNRARKMLSRTDLVFTFLHLADTLGLVSPEAPRDEQVEARTHLNLFKKFLYQLVQDSTLTPSLAEVLKTLGQYQEDTSLDLPVNNDEFKENAVRLMTIHIAKGLEFPVVFAACTEDTTRSNRSGFGAAPYVHFDPQYSKKGGFGLFIQKHHDEDTLKKLVYQNVWEKPREEAESKRKFYVAVTRAEKKLYVIRGPKSHAWTESSLYPQEALSVIVENDEPDDFYYRYCDPALDVKWREKVNHRFSGSLAVTVESRPKKKESPSVEPLNEENKSSLQGTLSFSKLNAFNQCPTRYWLQYVGRLPVPKQATPQVGTCVHQLIEKHYVNEGQVSEAEKALILDNAFAADQQTKRDKAVRLFEAFLASKYHYEILSKQGWQIESEKPIQFPVKGSDDQTAPAVFRGTLDLLLFNPETQQYKLIDFKTDRQRCPEKEAVYFQQLALYREGLRALWPERSLPNSAMVLVHVSEQEAEEITSSDSPSAEEIKQCILPIQRVHYENKLPERSATANCKTCPYTSLCPQASMD